MYGGEQLPRCDQGALPIRAHRGGRRGSAGTQLLATLTHKARDQLLLALLHGPTVLGPFLDAAPSSVLATVVGIELFLHKTKT